VTFYRDIPFLASPNRGPSFYLFLVSNVTPKWGVSGNNIMWAIFVGAKLNWFRVLWNSTLWPVSWRFDIIPSSLLSVSRISTSTLRTVLSKIILRTNVARRYILKTIYPRQTRNWVSNVYINSLTTSITRHWTK